MGLVVFTLPEANIAIAPENRWCWGRILSFCGTRPIFRGELSVSLAGGYLNFYPLNYRPYIESARDMNTTPKPLQFHGRNHELMASQPTPTQRPSVLIRI